MSQGHIQQRRNSLTKGDHIGRLGASKGHRYFVSKIKAYAVAAWGSIPNRVRLPLIFGALPLSFRMPLAMEEAFGYRARLPFVAFFYSPSTRQFGHFDGGDHVPSDENLWMWFLQHPLVAPEVNRGRYPTLYGEFGGNVSPFAPDDASKSGRHDQEDLQSAHCLLLDRRSRKPYICRQSNLDILFALTEPQDEDYHTVYVDGLLVSPGNENYKLPAPAGSREWLRLFLDIQFEATRGETTMLLDKIRPAGG